MSKELIELVSHQCSSLILGLLVLTIQIRNTPQNETHELDRDSRGCAVN